MYGAFEWISLDLWHFINVHIIIIFLCCRVHPCVLFVGRSVHVEAGIQGGEDNSEGRSRSRHQSTQQNSRHNQTDVRERYFQHIML